MGVSMARLCYVIDNILSMVMSDKLLTFVHACYYTKTDEDSSQEAPSSEPVANSPPQLLR